MNKSLVTGGCGFIGANFIRYMRGAYPEYHITNFDSLTYAGNRDNLIGIEGQDRYTFVKGDITNLDDVRRVIEGVDYIVHFAAESHVDRSIVDPSVFVKTNVMGTYNLLECAMKSQVKRFVHISTDEVYGSLSEDGYFTEETPLTPNSPYSASKAGSDLLVRAYCETYQFPGIITRCSNNYGPYQFPEKLIPLMISNALSNQKLPVYGDGGNVRDWLYVKDHCRAIDVILHKGKPGEVYNIGGNNEWHNIDLVKLLLKDLDKPESLIEFVEDRLGHDRRYAIDSSKIQNELGWTPQISFEEGMEKTIRWYRENTDWIKRIQTGEYQIDSD